MAIKVPKGWIIVTLNDCVDILDNARIPINADERSRRIGDIPYYGATGQVGMIDDFIFNEELLLIGEDGAPFFDKYKNIAYLITGKSWVNNHAHVLRAKINITSNTYLKHYINQFDFTGFVNGTTRLKLTQSSMQKIPILLAPFQEQRRISTKLEKIFKEINSIQNRLDKFPEFIGEFRKQVLNQAVTGKLTKYWRRGRTLPNKDAIVGFYSNLRNKKKLEPVVFIGEIQNPFVEKWAYIPLKFLIESLSNGIYKPDNFYEEDGIACLRMYNIENGKIRWFNVKRMRITKDEKEKYVLKKNDILINRVNSRYLVGKAAIISNLPEEAIFESKNIRMRLISNGIVAMFINYLFQTHIIRNVFEAEAKQTVGMATISQPLISNLLIPLPSLAEIFEIIKRTEKLLRLIDKVEKQYESLKEIIDELPQIFLAKAFNGKLVPKSPNDEPIEKLLERIEEEKVKSFKKQKEFKKKRFVKKTIKEAKIMEIIELLEINGRMKVEDVWKQSKYSNDIDEFYAQLKILVDLEKKIKDIKKEKIVYLELLK